MREFSYDVCIVGGLGHVGLPLGISFAAAGKKVVLLDLNKETAKTVAAGQMPFVESGAEPLLKQVINKTLFITPDNKAVAESRFVILSIGTPVDEHLNPDFGLFKKLISELAPLMSDDQHLVIRSTVFPGTTELVHDYLRAAGRKTKVSFCPERIAEGKAIEELKSLPQIVSAFDQATLDEAKGLFSMLTSQVIFLDPKEAELAKLFTNTWRYIQFAVANQFYQIAAQNGLDFYRIYQAATDNYPRIKGLPKAGFAAGPCLFKDTMQLAAYSNNNFFLGHAAMLINEGLPGFIVQKLKEKHKLKDMTVGILGMAFKGDSDDPRESLSYKLKKTLELEAGKVLCTDPFVKDAALVPLDDLLAKCNMVIVGAPHSAYKNLKFAPSTVVVDIWNFFGKGGAI
jgi:UDP-N-acetyl-D-mannosaminuronic acid dehydrogenase